MTNGFTSSVIITTLTKALKIIISIFVTIIIANTLGPEGQGIYKLAILLPNILITLGNFGLGQSIIYFYNIKEDEKQKVINASITFSLILTLVIVICGLILIIFFKSELLPGIGINHLIMGLTATPFLFMNSIIGAIFLAQMNTKLYNLTGVLNLIVFLVMLILFSLTSNLNTTLTIFSFSITSFLSFAYLILRFFSLGNTFKIEIDLKFYLRVLKFGLKIFSAGLINSIHYRIDAFLVNAFLSPTSLGIYSIATALSEKNWILSQSAGEMIFPRIAGEKNKNKSIEFTIQTYKVVMFITIIASLVLFFLSSFLIDNLFSKEYSSAILPFRILLIGTISMAGWRVLINDLYGRKILKPVIILGICALFLNILLNLYLIRKYGILGASISSAVTYTLSLISIIVVYTKYLDVQLKSFFIFNNSDKLLYIKFIKKIQLIVQK